MELQVKPIKQKDAGRSLAALDREALQALGADSGDYIQVVGPDGEKVVLRVWPGYPEDEGEGVIRFDGSERQATGAGIDDSVTVELADVEPATQVTVALPENLRVRGNLASYLRERLSGRAIGEGQQVTVSLDFGGSFAAGQSITLDVVATEPGGTVVVTDSTAIDVVEGSSDEPTGEAESDGDAESSGDGKDRGDENGDGKDRGGEDGDGETSGPAPVSGEISRGLSDWELVVRVTVSDLSLGIFVLVLVIALLTGTAYYLGQNTTTSFPGWLQVFGTVVSMLLTGLIVVYHYAGQPE